MIYIPPNPLGPSDEPVEVSILDAVIGTILSLVILALLIFALHSAGFFSEPTAYIEYTQACPSERVLRPDCECKQDGWVGHRPTLAITCSNPRP